MKKFDVQKAKPKTITNPILKDMHDTHDFMIKSDEQITLESRYLSFYKDAIKRPSIKLNGLGIKSYKNKFASITDKVQNDDEILTLLTDTFQSKEKAELFIKHYDQSLNGHEHLSLFYGAMSVEEQMKTIPQFDKNYTYSSVFQNNSGDVYFICMNNIQAYDSTDETFCKVEHATFMSVWKLEDDGFHLQEIATGNKALHNHIDKNGLVLDKKTQNEIKADEDNAVKQYAKNNNIVIRNGIIDDNLRKQYHQHLIDLKCEELSIVNTKKEMQERFAKHLNIINTIKTEVNEPPASRNDDNDVDHCDPDLQKAFNNLCDELNKIDIGDIAEKDYFAAQELLKLTKEITNIADKGFCDETLKNIAKATNPTKRFNPLRMVAAAAITLVAVALGVVATATIVGMPALALSAVVSDSALAFGLGVGAGELSVVGLATGVGLFANCKTAGSNKRKRLEGRNNGPNKRPMLNEITEDKVNGFCEELGKIRPSNLAK